MCWLDGSLASDVRLTVRLGPNMGYVPAMRRHGGWRDVVFALRGALVGLGVLSAVYVRWDRISPPVALMAVGLVAMGLATWLRVRDRGGTLGAIAKDGAWELGHALVTGAAVGLVLLGAQDRVEEDRFEREQQLEEDRIEREREVEDDRIAREAEAEGDRIASEARRDNIRFVRETVTQRDPVAKPFSALDLQAAELAGLDFTRARLVSTDLREANLLSTRLTGADMTWANFSAAVLVNTDLSGGNLFSADLHDANLTGANLTGATLTGADLTGATLTGAQLQDVDLDDVRYNDTTTWPAGFDPPRSG